MRERHLLPRRTPLHARLAPQQLRDAGSGMRGEREREKSRKAGLDHEAANGKKSADFAIKTSFPRGFHVERVSSRSV